MARPLSLRLAAILLAGATLTTLFPASGAAQASREGPSFGISGSWGGAVRRPDAAYDPVNNVYLVVSGNLVHGRFVNPDGAPIGTQFYVPTAGTHNQTARAAYSPDLGGFLVAWFDTRANPNAYQIWGRIVKFGAGGTPAFVGGDFAIGVPAGGGNAELGLDLAYATASRRFLVAYHQIGPPANDIIGQLIDTSGGLVGGPIPLTFDNHSQGEPSVSYNPTTDQFMVAWRHYYEPAGPGAVQVRTVAAATGAAGAIREVATATACYMPQVEYNGHANGFLLAWYQQPHVYGRLLAADGAPAGNITPLIYNYFTYDALGLRYNPQTGTYFAVIHGRLREDAGAQISAAAVPDVEFDVTATGARNGNFNPRVVANHSRKEWMVVTSGDFGTVFGQRVKSLNTGGGGNPPPPPPEPPPPTQTIDLSAGAAPNGSWFLAEGVESGTATGFHTFYLLANENDVPVNVRAYFASDSGRVTLRNYTVAPRSRTTISLADAAGAGSFGAVFQSTTVNHDIFVERSIYFGDNLEGSTGAEAVKHLSTHWLFAEGSRGGELFDNFFLLFNPSQGPLQVHFTFSLTDGSAVTRQYIIPAQQRLTVYANQIPELAGRDFSTTVVSTEGLVAERAMYWRLIGTATGTPWIGGSATLGATRTSGRWVFAEGAAAPGFETFYLLLNPNNYPISVRGLFMPESGAAIERFYQVPPGARFTVYLNQEVGHIGGAAAQFTSGAEFLAERSIYWGAGRVEGTSVVGSSITAYEWHLPEGTAGAQFDTFLLLGNPGTQNSTVMLTLFVEGIGRFTLPVMTQTVPAEGRRTIHMNGFLGQVESIEGLVPGTLRGKSFSTKVEVLNGPPIVVEHAIYWQRAGADYWRGGAGAFGIPR